MDHLFTNVNFFKVLFLILPVRIYNAHSIVCQWSQEAPTTTLLLLFYYYYYYYPLGPVWRNAITGDAYLLFVTEFNHHMYLWVHHVHFYRTDWNGIVLEKFS